MIARLSGQGDLCSVLIKIRNGCNNGGHGSNRNIKPERVLSMNVWVKSPVTITTA
jgi:hypothetical protein